MSIPVPSAKYNLLQDSTNKPKRIGKSICVISMIVMFLLFSTSCIVVYYVFGAEELKVIENSIGRPELYSLDEYLNKDAPCKLCDSPPKTLPIDLSDSQPPRLVCYYTVPDSLNDSTSLMPESIDCNLCTHINVGFIDVHNNSIVVSEIMKNIFSRVIELKSCNSQLKILFTVGGSPGDPEFPAMVRTHASRKVFIRSIKAILRQYKLDGVDLDWEFPCFSGANSISSYNLTLTKPNRERQHFSQLLREIRAEFVREKRAYLLTVAVAAPEHIVNLAYDVNEINQYADYINLMSYDFHFYTKYTPLTGLNSPLYSKPGEILYFATLNVNYSANLWLNLGMDRNKIVIGLPTYGHTFTLVNKRNGQIESPANGFGALGIAGFVNSTDICNFINNNKVNIMYDNQTSSPYFHKEYEWVSYENKDSMASKGRFVKESNFGGAMVYSLNNDDYLGRCSENSAEKFYLTRQLKDVLLDNDL